MEVKNNKIWKYFNKSKRHHPTNMNYRISENVRDSRTNCRLYDDSYGKMVSRFSRRRRTLIEVKIQRYHLVKFNIAINIRHANNTTGLYSNKMERKQHIYGIIETVHSPHAC